MAHVVAEARHLEALRVVAAAGGARPGADPRGDLRVLPVPRHRLAGDAQPRLDVRELAVTVRGLVEVHEVHVDLAPRQIAVELRVEVQKGLAEGLEAGDPHLGRTEGVHPRDHADAVLVRRRGDAGGLDSLGRLDDRLEDDSHRDRRGVVQSGRDQRGVVGDLPQGVLAVQVLAPGQEPDLVFAQGLHAIVPPSVGSLGPLARQAILEPTPGVAKHTVVAVAYDKRDLVGRRVAMNEISREASAGR